MQYRKVSIIIPVYDEEKTIEQVLDGVERADVLGLEKEIILVDDFSTDGTREILKKRTHPNLKVIYQDENQGKGSALHVGFAAATGDIAVIQDADLEYDPIEIKTVLEPFLQNNAKVVYGSRYLKPSEGLGFWHSLFNKLFTQIGNFLIGQKITDIMTCYKAFDREVIDNVFPKLESRRFGFEPEVTAKVSKLGYKILEVPISYQPRTHHQGKHMNFKGQVESLLALIKYSLF
jgi:glycosyltransferase involved in cell wall biosynthesis